MQYTDNKEWESTFMSVIDNLYDKQGNNCAVSSATFYSFPSPLIITNRELLTRRITGVVIKNLVVQRRDKGKVKTIFQIVMKTVEEIFT